MVRIPMITNINMITNLSFGRKRFEIKEEAGVLHVGYGHLYST